MPGAFGGVSFVSPLVGESYVGVAAIDPEQQVWRICHAYLSNSTLTRNWFTLPTVVDDPRFVSLSCHMTDPAQQPVGDGAYALGIEMMDRGESPAVVEKKLVMGAMIWG
jgi:hypothetical protein